jgi:UDP-glucose 4-epimerase
MKTLVIGGAGFIGSHVSSILVENGRMVTVLDRAPTPIRRLPETVKYLSGDYGDKNLLQEVLASTDEVIDLAYTTVPKTSFENPAYDILSNLPQGVSLLEGAVQNGHCKVLLVSSGGTVYGVAQSLPITEDHPTNPVSPYGITKLTMEKYAWMFHTLHGLPVTVVRPGNAYGEGQFAFTGQGFIATAIQSILTGQKIEVFGEHGTVRDYLHVHDLALGILAALNFGEPGQAYNIGSGIGRNNRDILNILKPLAEIAGYPITVNFLPSRKFDVPANVLDCSKLKSISGWKPRVSLEDGLRQTWLQALETHEHPSHR